MGKKELSPDVAIIGGGPAGLTAAIYASRAALDTVVLENEVIGGQMSSTVSVENFPSYESVTGAELSDKMKKHALVCGAVIEAFDTVRSVELSASEKLIMTDERTYRPKTVIIATGSSPVRLPVQSEEKLRGHGIHYCTACDGALYRGKAAAVIGGGNSALESGVYLAGLAREVLMIRRRDSYHGERVLIDRLKSMKNVRILYNWDLADVIGENNVKGIIVKNTKSNSQTLLPVDAVFGCIGHKPETDMLRGMIKLDEHGYILTNEQMSTDIDGVFAAGDVRAKQYRQITTAVSDGTIAALNAERFIALGMK